MILPDDERNKFISLKDAVVLVSKRIGVDTSTTENLGKAVEVLGLNLSMNPHFKLLTPVSYWPPFEVQPLSHELELDFRDTIFELVTEGVNTDFLESTNPMLVNFGFYRAEFITAIYADPDKPPEKIPEKPPREPPNEEDESEVLWDKGLYLRKRFTIQEAACIIEGITLDEADAYNTIFPFNLSNMEKAIRDAAEELGEDPNHFYEVGHDAIAQWCEREGLKWPLKKRPQTKPEEATTGPSHADSQCQQIQFSGPTFAKLIRAFEAFIVKYPDYKTNAPKLNDDVRPWMQKPPLKCSVREAQVFSLIIFETLGLPIKT